jgi:hypothetical protein
MSSNRMLLSEPKPGTAAFRTPVSAARPLFFSKKVIENQVVVPV